MTFHSLDPKYLTAEVIDSVTIRRGEYAISVHNENGEMAVGIRWDGSVRLSPDCTPDEAAQRFWDAVVGMVPAMQEVLDPPRYTEPQEPPDDMAPDEEEEHDHC